MATRKQNEVEREVNRRINELRRNPPKFDKWGNRFPEVPTFSEALNFVWTEDPVFAKDYAEAYEEKPSGRVLSYNESAGEEIMRRVQEKMKANKRLSYSEALVEVQLEEPNLIREFLGLS
jgi:hypothetical protein